MKDAMAAMKAELGDDAVILHSKKYKEGGVLGIGSKEVVEITAAVEESSMPQKEIAPKPAPPKPTLFSSAANKYKTSGTIQGVEQAEKDAEILDKPLPRPSLVQENPQHNLQSDALTAKIAAQNKTPTLIKPTPQPETNFAEILQETKEPEQVSEPAEVESQSDAEILNSVEENEPEEVAEEKISETEEVKQEENQPEEKSEIEESSQPEKSEKPAEEKISETEEVKQEENQPEEKSEVEESSQPEKPEEPAEEKNSETEEVKQEETKEPEQKVEEKPEETPQETSEPEKTAEEKTQQTTELTPEQLAQAQAAVFAQINQMQMAQVMQQAVAQAQAQAQMQVAEMAEQMREVHRQRLEASGQIIPQTQPQQSEQDKIQKLEEEIAHMKALLAEVLGKESRQGGLSLHEALRRQEVDEEILTEMATQSGAGDTLLDSKSAGARITLSNYLTEHLKFSDGIKLNRHGVRLVALLGTTGVGKTTTLAKIAAKFVLEHGVNAALITADTYRISAVEQLKTYSDILGLPLEIVYTPTELNAAIDKHKHKELILIDTAGRSQQNAHQMRELEEFLRINPRIEKHLVISATTKLTDANDIMNKFSAVNPEKIIVTKIDETASLGMIVNLLRNKKTALSYITTGQSVPDDIELATADILTDLILKKVVV